MIRLLRRSWQSRLLIVSAETLRNEGQRWHWPQWSRCSQKPANSISQKRFEQLHEKPRIISRWQWIVMAGLASNLVQLDAGIVAVTTWTITCSWDVYLYKWRALITPLILLAIQRWNDFANVKKPEARSQVLGRQIYLTFQSQGRARGVRHHHW